MNFSPLTSDIIRRENLPVLTLDALDAAADEQGDLALFISGDWNRRVEVNDVAVIFPEILKAAGGALAGVVLARESERAAQARYRFNRFPCLVFLRGGGYLGALQEVLDWTDYVREINAILARAPSEPPPFKFPEGCAPAPAAARH